MTTVLKFTPAPNYNIVINFDYENHTYSYSVFNVHINIYATKSNNRQKDNGHGVLNDALETAMYALLSEVCKLYNVNWFISERDNSAYTIRIMRLSGEPMYELLVESVVVNNYHTNYDRLVNVLKILPDYDYET